MFASAFVNASHAARCVACHGVRSHAEAVALVIECSIPVCLKRDIATEASNAGTLVASITELCALYGTSRKTGYK